MIKLEDLVCINNDERCIIIESLYELFDTDIITGFNWYNEKPLIENSISFSHIHGDDKYKENMIESLCLEGYTKEYLLDHIRQKSGTFKWKLNFIIDEDEKKNGLIIKNKKIGKYLDLNKYSDKLNNYPEFNDTEGEWVAENFGWQLDLPFNCEEELKKLVKIFTYHYGKKLYDGNFELIQETEEESKKRSWTNSYDIPTLVLGSSALNYKNELSHFLTAKRIILRKENNEISFVINENLKELHNSPQYKLLTNFGFKEEHCLGNIEFIDFVDGY